MPVVQIFLWKGKTTEQKRKLVEEITNSFESVMGTGSQNLHIMFLDIDKIKDIFK